MSVVRQAAAQFVGTALLLAAVVGSGIMGERLADGNVAIALLANALATGFALVALIVAFGARSGAHFNPVVTLVLAARNDFPARGIPGDKARAWSAPAAVGAYIAAAYWFTASTSFANPAVTLARRFTTTFAGISPGHIAPFVVAQLFGAGVGLALDRMLTAPSGA